MVSERFSSKYRRIVVRLCDKIKFLYRKPYTSKRKLLSFGGDASLQELGEYLRRIREAKEISLNDIQDITKIRYSYLEAIEAGNLEVIPGEVYQKGFIVSYANALGLNSQEVLQKYHELKAKKAESENLNEANVQKNKEANQAKVNNSKNTTAKNDKTTKPGPFKKAKIPLNKKQKSPLQYPLWLPKYGLNSILIGIVAGLVAFLVIGWFFWQSSTGSTQTNDSTKVKSTKILVQTSVPPIVSPVSNIASSKKNGKVVKQIFPAPVTVYVEFVAQVLMQITTDGKQLFAGEGEKIDAKSPPLMLTAQKEMIVQVSDPASVRLTLNGNEIGSFGETGRSCTVIFTEKGFKLAP